MSEKPLRAMLFQSTAIFLSPPSIAPQNKDGVLKNYIRMSDIRSVASCFSGSMPEKQETHSYPQHILTEKKFCAKLSN